MLMGYALHWYVGVLLEKLKLELRALWEGFPQWLFLVPFKRW